MSDQITRKESFAGHRKVLLGGAAALALLGATFAEGLLVPATPAFAQPVTVDKPLNAPASFAPLVQQVSPAVVSIRVDGTARGAQTSSNNRGFLPDMPEDFDRFLRRFGDIPGFNRGDAPRGGGQRQQMGQGSGFIISADGVVVTNNHVVDKGDKVEVKTGDGATYAARVVGVDEKTDIAVLKIDGAGKTFPFVRFSEKSPQVGDWVVAVGNPFGLGGTVTAGIVSARGRDIGATAYDDFLQIDAPINKGNSGGPAFNLNGEVIGINTAIYSPSSGGSVGIGFAIPAEVAQRVVEEIRQTGQVTRGWLGVSIQPVTRDIADSMNLGEARGALVSEAQSGSPAAKAGVKSGDVVLSVNGEAIKDARELSRKVAELDPNATAKLGLWRDGREQTVEVKLGTLPGPDRQASRAGEGVDLGTLGLSVAPAASVAGAGEKGVVVTDVKDTSDAARKGLKEGDVLLEVAGKAVERPADVEQSLKTARDEGRKAVLFRVRSGEQTRYVALSVQAG